MTTTRPANAVVAGLLAYGRDQEVRPQPHWLVRKEACLQGPTRDPVKFLNKVKNV